MLKRLLIIVLLSVVFFTTDLGTKVEAEVVSSQFSVVTNRPRFAYYNDYFDNSAGIDIVISSNKPIPAKNDTIATIEYVKEDGTVTLYVDRIQLEFVYSGVGTVYDAPLQYDFLVLLTSLSDIDDAGVTFYRVRINDIILYTGAYMSNPEIDNSEPLRVEFNFYPYNDDADYDPTKQYQFTSGVQDNVLFLHYKCSDTDVATKSINFYKLSTGIVINSISLTQIMIAQLTYDFGAIEPDPNNLIARNSFIPVSIDGELIEALKVNINGINEPYEDLLQSMNLGSYGIFIGIDDPISVENVADAVWFNTNSIDRKVFDLIITPEQVKIDVLNELDLSFIQDQTYISDYYETFDLLYETSVIGTPTSILGGRDFDQYEGNFTVRFNIDENYPEDTIDTITWIVTPSNMEDLGVSNDAYSIWVDDTYVYKPSQDIGASLYDGFTFFGLKNETGGLFLIASFIIMATIILAWSKASLIVYLITYVMIVAIFAFLGLSTLWFNITFGLLVIIGFSISMRRNE